MGVWDRAANSARPAGVDDLRRAVKLLDSYGAEGISPVHPQEVPPELRQVVTAKVSYEHSRNIGSYMQATSIAEAECLCRMGAAAGRKGPHISLQIVHSPMKLDAHSLRLILDMKRAGRTPAGITAGGGAMPLAGAAAPLLLPGLLAQGLAEALAAYGTPGLLNDAVSGYLSVFPGTFDMRYTGYSMGSAESVLYWLAVRQMLDRVFGWTIGGDFACTAKAYDAQAGAQKMAAILTSVLSGATTFANVGMTPTDEVFHFGGAVIDMEILNYAWRVGRGLAWESVPTSDTVREGRGAGTFLLHPTTMRFRDEIWDPRVFTNDSLGQWLAQGSPSVVDKASRVAEDRIAAHEYSAPADVRRELDRLLDTAKTSLS
jgi:trimethylamine:corrinoid methyltransferase-like protein